MRSMLQLVGGVAVAGAVAAGGTAFTAAGLTPTLAATTPGFIGGKVTHTVVGAVLTGITFAQTANAGENKITGATLTFTGAPDGAHVVMTTDGTPAGGANGIYCPDIASGTTVCVVGTAANAATGNIPAVTSVDITVS